MYPPTPKPMEAATMARRGGLLVQSRPGSTWARARTWGVGYSTTPSAARRRQLVASLGVRESFPAQSMGDDAVAVEVNLARSHGSIDLAQVDEDANDSAEILSSPDAPDAKTVRVKFVLEKKCAFGQQFLVVGDDPALGLWDPAKAVTLDWSDGHVWTVQTDLPANMLIEFKFLLRDASGHVRWQHGANRTLQTTDTPNTLVVHEDWDGVMNQRVSEEEEVSIVVEDVAFSDDLAAQHYSFYQPNRANGAVLAVADELRTGENLQSNNDSAVAEASVHEEVKGSKEEKEMQFISENDQMIRNELNGKADTEPQNGYLFYDADADDNDDETMASEDDDTAIYQEDAQIVNRSTSVFENDLIWVRKALQQLLRFLGFQIGTTRT